MPDRRASRVSFRLLWLPPAALAGMALLIGLAGRGGGTPHYPPPHVSRLPVSALHSVTYIEERPLADYADDLIGDLPALEHAGFNTVWLVLPWYEFEPRPFAGVYDERNFQALRDVLGAVGAHGMRAILPLDYLGKGWAPQGIDACTWVSKPKQERAFESYVRGFLERIQNYSVVPYILLFTEATHGCPGNRPAGPVQLAATLRRTLGSIPSRLPLGLRRLFSIGYHDDSLVTLGWAGGASPVASPNPFDFLSMTAYGLEHLKGSEIRGALKERIARFRAIAPHAPLMIGELGASRCDGGAANQARVDREIVSFALRHGLGFNVWHWRPVANEDTCTVPEFRALSLLQDGHLNAAGRALKRLLTHQR